MKNIAKVAGIFIGLIWCLNASAQLPTLPPFPTDPYLDSWSFYDATNWFSDLGYAPIAFTNIVDDESCWSSDDGVLDCNGLILDSTNAAFLNYNIVENNGHTNLICPAGVLWFWFSPDWSSTNQGGTGPGNWGEFIDTGAWTSNAAVGYWGLSVDSAGDNIYFTGQTNGVSTNYFTCPISWSAGSWHLIALIYTATNSVLNVDGQLATNGIGVSYWPGHDVLTNGFWIGSDAMGNEQARGEFVDVETYSDQFFSEYSTNYFSDYYNEMSPEFSGSSGGFGGSGPDFDPPDLGGGGGSGYTNIYGTNLWLYIAGVQTNTIGLFLMNTEPDIQYEIQSLTNLLQTNWNSEGFVLGSEITNLTPMNLAQGDRTNNLFMRIRSWIDENGSGIPDWWELEYFGTTGVDPYGDAEGDGWNNLQKFQKGMNPNVFYTPPAPQNLTLQVDSTGTNVTLSWQSGGGNVSEYQISDDWDGALGTVSASQTNYTTSLGIDFFGTEFSTISFQVTAQFTNGDSASATVNLEPTSDYSLAQVVRNSEGQFELVTSHLPPDVTKIRLFWVTDFDPFAPYEGEEDNAYYDVAASNIVNGVYVLPNSVMETYQGYTTLIETLHESGQYDWDGIASEIADSDVATNLPVAVDASARALKDNLVFLLRSATIDHSFSYESEVTWSGSENLGRSETGPDYEYSGYRYYDTNYNQIFTDIDRPIEENYLWRNFAYVSGDLNTGASSDYYSGERSAYSAYPGDQPEYEIPSADLPLTAVPYPLLTNGTSSFYFYALAGYAPYADIGLAVDASTNVYLPTGVKNLYGLQIEAVKGFGGGEVDAGASATSWGTLAYACYVETATPSLETIGYYFASEMYFVPQVPVPGTPGFSSTNTSPLLIAGIGQTYGVMGWAKQVILNGYTNKFAYLEQYFDQAYQIDTNGVVTTNSAGTLSPYGEFNPTQPGPAALVTMPDVDTSARGTATVYCVSMNVDANHDGNMDLNFRGADATLSSSPMEFWVNNGYDGVNGDAEVVGGVQPNYSFGNITGERDLENLARLWICGMPAVAANQNYTVTLNWQNTSGNPAINLYNSAETNGGTEYLTDTNVAAQQSALTFSGSPYSYQVTGMGAAIAQIANGTTFTFPASYFTNSGNKYFLFEGAGIGSGELTMTIFDSNSNTVAQTGAWLDLHDIKDFYERAIMTDNTSGAISNWSSTVETVQPAISSALGNDTNLIVFVHGINVPNWNWLDDSDTVFKRLYWAGYQGKFATVKWPCTLTPLLFDSSELYAYKASTSLKTYLSELRTRFPNDRLNIFAHSQGNAVVSEAIEQGAPFDAYILTQGAMPASCYDASASTDSDLTGQEIAPYLTPNLQPMGYLGLYTNINLGGRIVNFYNTNDFALESGRTLGLQTNWKRDQELKPNTGYYSDGTNVWDDGPLVTDSEQSRAMVARSRTDAVGATAGLNGVMNSTIDLLAQFGFGNTLDEHSAQWTRPIQTSRPYFQQVLVSFQIQPAP